MIRRAWLRSLRIMFLRFIPIGTSVGILFLLVAEYYSIVGLFHILSVCLLNDGHLDCFQHLIVHVQVFVCEHVISFLLVDYQRRNYWIIC